MNKKIIVAIITAIVIIAGIIGVILLNNSNNTNTNFTDKVEGLSLNNSETTNDNNVSSNSKALVVYFSVPETTNPNNMTRDEDNSTVVVDGKVLGNVQYIAQTISEKTGSDIYRLEPTNAYPTNHQDLLERAANEQRQNARPEIQDKKDISDYDVIFLGYPIWNSDLPPIVYTFLENNNFDGKTIVPFILHGGSGSAGTPSTLTKTLNNSNVITNAFVLSRTEVDGSETKVTSWLKEIGVTEQKNNNVTTSSNNNVLVAYYSYSGTTEKMAKNIHDIVGGDIFEIETKENYSSSEISEVSKDEIDNKKSRELKDKPQSIDQYDVIYVGFPIWYSTTPRVINTFLESYDLSDKTIVPFCTSSSSGIDGAIPAIKESAPNSKILDGIRMSGSTANSSEGKTELQNWINGLGL